MKTTLICSEFKPLSRGTLAGFADVEIKELRMKILGCAVHQKAGRRWCQLPAKPMLRDGQPVLGDDGRIKYTPTMSFDSREVADAFSSAVVAAVLAHAPTAFDEAKPERSYAERRDDTNIPF